MRSTSDNVIILVNDDYNWMIINFEFLEQGSDEIVPTIRTRRRASICESGFRLDSKSRVGVLTEVL